MNQSSHHAPPRGPAREGLNRIPDGPSRAPPSRPLRGEKAWAAAVHLSCLLLFVGLPLANILLPWLIWRWWRPRSALVDHHGKEALNFQISMTLYAVFLGLLSYFTVAGLVLLTVLGIFDVIYVGIAADHAHGGRKYDYPLAIRFVS